MKIEIENLTKAQEIAIEDLLTNWQFLGAVGASRWTAFYADGDGNFRPKILVNGEKPKHQNIVNGMKFSRKVTIGDNHYKNRFDADYAIDFDVIAWALRDKEEG